MEQKKVWAFCNCERVQKEPGGKFVRILTSQLVALTNLLDIEITPLDQECPSCRQHEGKQNAA